MCVSKDRHGIGLCTHSSFRDLFPVAPNLADTDMWQLTMKPQVSSTCGICETAAFGSSAPAWATNVPHESCRSDPVPSRRSSILDTADAEPGRGLCLEPHDCAFSKMVAGCQSSDRRRFVHMQYASAQRRVRDRDFESIPMPGAQRKVPARSAGTFGRPLCGLG